MNANSWQDVVMLITLFLGSLVGYIIINLREGEKELEKSDNGRFD